MLPACAKRCRTWKHKNNCEYIAQKEVPITKGLEDKQTPLCSCGLGRFPPNYLEIPEAPLADEILRRYATRVAIGPVFAASHVEESSGGLLDFFIIRLAPACSFSLSTTAAAVVESSTGGTTACSVAAAAAATGGGEKCNNCGQLERKDGNDGVSLSQCSRCHAVKYCSRECQVAKYQYHKHLVSDAGLGQEHPERYS